MPFIKISGLTTATAVSATNQFEINQNGGSRSATVAQVAAFARTSATDPVVLPAGTVSAPALTFTGDTNTGIYSPAADTIAFTEGGVEAMRLDASGNLLLGVTTTGSPGISLSSAYNIGWTQSAGESVPNVFRQASSAATVMANGYRFTATANGFASSFSSSYAKTAISCGTASGAITFYTDPASAVAAGTDVTPSERMRITAAGNVGVGDTNPTPVYGYTNVISVSSNYPGVQFNSAASSTLKKFQIGLGIDSFQFYDGSAAAERMRIDASGNVGIGTSNPQARIDVVNTSASHGIANFTQLNTSFNTDLTLYNAANITSNTLISKRTDGGLWFYQSGASYIAAYTNAAERMRIDASGNVGIGTTPSYRLHVVAFNPTNNIVQYNVNGTGGSSRSRIGFQDGSTGFAPDLGSVGNTLTFDTVGQERVRIDGNGNVGINTTTASYRLDVQGNALVGDGTDRTPSVNWDGQLNIRGSGYTGGISLNAAGMWVGHNSGGRALIFATDETERMRIDASGNVGIGTASPQSALDVQSNSNYIARFTGTSNGYLGATIVNSNSGSAARTYLQFGNNASQFGAFITLNSSTNTTELGGANALGIYNGLSAPIAFATAGTERARIDSSGNFYVGRTAISGFPNEAGIWVSPTQGITIGKSQTTNLGSCIYMNRLASVGDGTLIDFAESGTIEGNISISGTTVSYNGGHLSRWSQLPTQQRDPALLKGTVLSNLDEMCEWLDDEGNPLPNEQLNRMKISDVEGDTNVAGVFVNWDNDDQVNPYDMNIAMTGDMIIRIAAGVAVQKGMLLMSAGDGTAKPQGDDIVRSKTIAKVTSNHVTCTYPDGSYCVPCVLMAC